MKKLIIAILILLPSFAFAGMQDAHKAVIARMNVASGSCDTEKDAETGAETSVTNFARYASNSWLATKFTAGSAYTVCKIGMYLKRTDTASTYNITACIYSDDGGAGADADPLTVVGSCSSSVAESTLTTSTTEIEFTGVSAELTSGTSYWVVVYSSGVDGNNYAFASLFSSASVELIKKDDDGSGNWTEISQTSTLRYQLYE